MKLAGIFSALGIGLGALAFVAFQGCSSSSSDSGTGGSGVGGPPAKPSAPATTSTTEKNFAVHTLLLGDAARGGGAQSTSAWKKYGYNVDGVVSNGDATQGCKGTKAAKIDGDNGIDNSFGANIVQTILTTAGQDAPTKINQAISDGKFTVMLDITGLSDDAKQSATGLKGIILAGGGFDDDGGTKPTFTSADNWPVRPELLSNPSDPKSSTISLGDAYVNAGTFVANAEVKLSLILFGVSLDLNIHHGIITFDHTQPNHADNGTIAGVVKTTELVEGLKNIAGYLGNGQLCSQAALQGLLDTITAASDIMADGSAGDPATACDGISVGLGFTADVIGNPAKVAAPTKAEPNPCDADGGK